MAFHRHPTRTCLLLATVAALCRIVTADDDDLAGLLKEAPAATVPAPVTAPDAPENRPTDGAAPKPARESPADTRQGSITLNDGTKLEGSISTTLDTPLRLWIDNDKRYLDIDLADTTKLEVHVVSETLEADWRWLKEGSDQKIYSGKKYPLVDLAYVLTLTNGQKVEGTVVAPIYVDDAGKRRLLALNKKLKGDLDQTLKDLKYITAITFAAAASTPQTTKTTKLPMLDD